MDRKRGLALKQPLFCQVLALLIVCGIADSDASCTRSDARAPRKAFRIEATDFSEALQTWHAQSGVSVSYADDHDPSGDRVRPLLGQFTPCEALARLLRGGPFQFQFRSSNEVSIRFEGKAGSAKPAGLAEDSPLELERIDRSPPDFAAYLHVPEVVVTGTHVEGGVQDLALPVSVVGVRELQASPYGTIEDALRSSLPLMGNSGPSDFFDPGNNPARGSSVDLRGLGPGGTLTLVDGYRQPPASLGGDFVDVSGIPVFAVDRIEVLKDGASAQYGADAVAGVVNIIMRHDLEGAESQVRWDTAPGGAAETVVGQLWGHKWDDGGKVFFAYQFSDRDPLRADDRRFAASADKVPLGGSNFSTYYSNPGNLLDPSTLQPLYAIPRGQSGTGLTVNRLLPGAVNLQNQMAGFDLVAHTQVHAIFASGQIRITDAVELFGEERLTLRNVSETYVQQGFVLPVPSTNPYFVTLGAGPQPPYELVAYNFLSDLGHMSGSGTVRTHSGTMGMRGDITDRLNAQISGTFGEESMRWWAYNQPNPLGLQQALADTNPLTAFNPFGDGSHTNPATLNELRWTPEVRSLSEIATVNVLVNGDLLALPSGPLKAAVGGEFRHEVLDDGDGRLRRNVSSVFSELVVPLFGRSNDSTGPAALELSLAARTEHYSDAGSASSPKLGLRYIVSQDVEFRGSWGRSFHAPLLLDLYDTSQNATFTMIVPDPHSPTGYSTVLGIQGNNPNLHNETAHTWTAGVDFTPTAVPNLQFSLTYFAIDYRDRAFNPAFNLTLAQILANSQWASLVVRNPTAAQVAALCSSAPYFFGREPQSQCLASNPQVLLDGRVRNLSSTLLRGVDLDVRDAVSTRIGLFHFGMKATYDVTFRDAVTPTAESVDLLNTTNNPLRLKYRVDMDWARHDPAQSGWGAGLAVNGTGGFNDTTSSPPRSAAAYTTLDLNVSYRTAAGQGLFDGSEIGINVVNVANAQPPFVDQILGYDHVNFQPYGRVVGVRVRKMW